MPALIDNLIAYRILSMLVKPFNETEAFKLGIIDEHGKVLIKPSKFTSSSQRNAFTYLHRLVFNIKKMINKLPGGQNKLKNIVAALYLIKEAYNQKQTSINEDDLNRVVSLLDEGLILVEEELTVSEFISLNEEGEGGPAPAAPANVTGSKVSTDIPVIKPKKNRKFAAFTVNDDVFRRFQGGKSKFRRWASYLNLENEGEKMIYDFAKKNPKGVIVLKNGKQEKAIRFNRHGGGQWSKINRPVKQINNEVV